GSHQRLAIPVAELCAVELPLAFRNEHPVYEKSEILFSSLAAFGSRSHKLKASLLESDISVRMLSYQPCRPRSIKAHHADPWPSILPDDLAQSRAGLEIDSSPFREHIGRS